MTEHLEKYILTGALCLCSFAYGLCVAILGPTLLDLKLLVGVSIKDISYGFVVNQGLFCVSSLFWGWGLNKIMSRELGLMIAIAMCAISTAVTPYLRSLATFLIALSASGASFAGIDIATSAWMIDIWRDKANMFLQMLYFFASIGNTVSPLLSEPFLAIESENLTDISQDDLSEEYQSRIHIPYFICAAIMFSSLAVQALFYIKDFLARQFGDARDDDKKDDFEKPQANDVKEPSEISSNPSSSRLYYWTILTLVSVLFCFFLCTIENTRNYLQAFVVNTDLKLTKSKGSFMASAFIGAFTVTRLISIAIAARISASVMLAIDFALILIGNVIVAVFANTSEVALWIGFIIIGMGSASCVGAMYTIAEERIGVNNFVCGVFMFGSAIATTIYPLFIGEYIEKYSLIYVLINLVSVIICIVTYVFVFIADWLHNRREKRDSQVTEESDDIAQMKQQLPGYQIDYDTRL